MGELFEDPPFKNAILDAMIRTSYLKDENGAIHLPDPAFVCKHALLGSRARACVVDLYACLVEADGLELNAVSDRVFLKDVLKAMIKKCDVKAEEGDFRKKMLERCDYHEH